MGEPLEMMTLVGVNVPPALLSLGVTVTGAVSVPLAPTVKFVDGTPVFPLVGPVRVTAVATAAAVYPIEDGSVSPPLFVVLMVFAPALLAV